MGKKGWICEFRQWITYLLFHVLSLRLFISGPVTLFSTFFISRSEGERKREEGGAK